MIYTVKGFVVVSKAEVDVLLELSCLFYNPMDVGNLISGSSAFSKSGLNIWKFMVHILLNPCLGNYEPYFASVWRGQWHPTPVLLPGESHGQRSLVGCSPWGHWGSDTPERLHFHFSLSCIGEGNGSPLQCSYLEIPGKGESGGLPSMGSHRVGHDWSDLAAAVAVASVWDECNCAVVWAFFGIAFLWDWNENWPLPVLWPLLSFQNLLHIECSTVIASCFRIWKSSTGIPSLPLALLVVMLPKACLTLHSRMSGSRWVITPLWLSGSWRSFLYSSSVYSCHLFLTSSGYIRSILFLSFIEPNFTWNVHLVSLIFLKRSLVFSILLFSSISLHWSLKKTFLSLLAILWTLHSKGYIFSFLLCLSFSSFPEILLALYISRFVCERSLQHGNTSGKEQKNP